MPLSFESVLANCSPRAVWRLRLWAGINMSPVADAQRFTEAQRRVVAEWCLENDLTPEDLSALARHAGRFDDDEHTYAEHAPGCAAALASLAQALGDESDVNPIADARTFTRAVADELKRVWKATQAREALALTLPPQQAPAATHPNLLQHLQAIPVTWTQVYADRPVYRADDNGQNIWVALDAAQTVHIQVSNALGLDRASTTYPDEAPYLIRGLIAALAHRSLERLDGAAVAAAVPPWAAEHVRRSMDERCDEYQRIKQALEDCKPSLTRESEKRRGLKMLLGEPAKPKL